MKEWTFLLQKDGDRSWLPLDSPDVEILEGRYRIVAQTDCPHTDVNIRVCHLATEEEPPKRRIQKRSNRTNGNGLMVVAPFTHLQPGNWELSCFLSDPMSDLVGDTLHHAVRLRVCAAIAADEEEWDAPTADLAEMPANPQIEPDAASVESTAAIAQEVSIPVETPSAHDLAALNVEIAQALGVSMERLVEMTDHLSHQLVNEIFREFSLAPSTVDVAATAVDHPAAISEPAIAESFESLATQTFQPVINAACLQIELEKAVWMAKRGDALAIAGQIQLIDSPASQPPYDLDWSESELEDATPQEIQIQLRDPQTSEVLFHACQSFPTDKVPCPFSFLCRLPEDLTTHLLLGEVVVAGTLPGADGVLVTLKTFHFTVTVDPEALVEELHKVTSALVENSDQEEVPDVMVQLSDRLRKEKARQELDLSFLSMTPTVTEQLPKTAETPAPMKVRVTAGQQILPPQLYQPEAEMAGKRKLELPGFVGARSGATAIAEPVTEAAVTEEAVFDLQESGLDLILSLGTELFGATSSEPLDAMELPLENTLAESSSEPVLAAESSPQPPSDSGAEDLALLDELSSPIRSAFQALNLQERFLNRLSAIAADAELTTLLKLAMPPIEESDVEPATVATDAKAATPELVQDFSTNEIVVDDDPSWREWLKRAGSRTKRVEPESETVASEPISTNLLVLDKEQPVPMPTLEIATDEIVAGRLIQVRVKLPDLLPKIYVKLWVNDRQTRSLLDGPRWLVDFLPNGLGELEATTQLIAPLGSLEMRVEAIAVEMQTQRESQKVSLDREVLPADVPDDLFSDLDLQGLGF
ncbi:MAG: hypothetical protein IGS48_16650 [Oscillatoriales cyanobacterium C42_A2020_001]|nr:hypothetical protein [Leptolyngbyaceae cyanobacterium C42_A2020_001]